MHKIIHLAFQIGASQKIITAISNTRKRENKVNVDQNWLNNEIRKWEQQEERIKYYSKLLKFKRKTR